MKKLYLLLPSIFGIPIRNVDARVVAEFIFTFATQFHIMMFEV